MRIDMESPALDALMLGNLIIGTGALLLMGALIMATGGLYALGSLANETKRKELGR